MISSFKGVTIALAIVYVSGIGLAFAFKGVVRPVAAGCFFGGAVSLVIASTLAGIRRDTREHPEKIDELQARAASLPKGRDRAALELQVRVRTAPNYLRNAISMFASVAVLLIVAGFIVQIR